MPSQWEPIKLVNPLERDRPAYRLTGQFLEQTAYSKRFTFSQLPTVKSREWGAVVMPSDIMKTAAGPVWDGIFAGADPLPTDVVPKQIAILTLKALQKLQYTLLEMKGGRDPVAAAKECLTACSQAHADFKAKFDEALDAMEVELEADAL